MGATEKNKLKIKTYIIPLVSVVIVMSPILAMVVVIVVVMVVAMITIVIVSVIVIVPVSVMLISSSMVVVVVVVVVIVVTVLVAVVLVPSVVVAIVTTTMTTTTTTTATGSRIGVFRVRGTSVTSRNGCQFRLGLLGVIRLLHFLDILKLIMIRICVRNERVSSKTDTLHINLRF